MSEYIVSCDDEAASWIGNDADSMKPLVRCRDCKYGYEDRRNTALGWVDMFVCVSEQWSTSSLMPSHKVKPDGFCAWGEKKVDE